MNILLPATEVPITKDTKAWIESYIVCLKNWREEVIESLDGEIGLAIPVNRGILEGVNRVIDDLQYRIFLFDNPHYGDTGNKNEWE